MEKGCVSQDIHHAGLVPEKYRHMTGWKSYHSALSRLKDMQKKHNFDVLICISHGTPEGIPEKIAETCSKLNFYVFTCFQWYESGYWLSTEDRHPSEQGHQIIADTIFNFMVKEKLVEKYLEKE